MADPAARIRWQDPDSPGNHPFIGHVTGLEDVFRIHPPEEPGDDEWVLTTWLPGLTERQLFGVLDNLKLEAERWLEQFVTSLGAIFPAEAAGNEAGENKAEPETPPAKRPVLTSMYVFDVLYSAGFTPWGNGEPGFTTGWYMDAITVDHVGADLPVHGPLEGPRAIIADYAQTLYAAGFDTHITVNTVLVRKRAHAATGGE